jgi:hypothetical protein
MLIVVSEKDADSGVNKILLEYLSYELILAVNK